MSDRSSAALRPDADLAGNHLSVGNGCFILVIGAFVFSYASRQYAVKNIDGILASAGEEESRRHRMIRKIVTVGCSIAAAAIVVVIVLLMPKDTAGDYTKVAEFLTEDTRMGPMEYGDAVYVPVNEEADLEKTELPRAIWQSVESAATVGFISLRLQIFCIPIRPENKSRTDSRNRWRNICTGGIGGNR